MSAVDEGTEERDGQDGEDQTATSFRAWKVDRRATVCVTDPDAVRKTAVAAAGYSVFRDGDGLRALTGKKGTGPIFMPWEEAARFRIQYRVKFVDEAGEPVDIPDEIVASVEEGEGLGDAPDLAKEMSRFTAMRARRAKRGKKGGE